MKRTTRYFLPLLALALLAETSHAQTAPYSQRMADAFMTWHPDSMVIGKNKMAGWGYEQGLMMHAMERVWQRSGDAKYFSYIKKNLDYSVQADGSIKGYKQEDYNLDNMATGRALLLLSQVSVPGNEKYIKAVQYLRKQLDGQPRTKEGGFWHKKVYTNQMWLDGLYMAEPFYAEYSTVFNQPAGLRRRSQAVCPD